MNCTKCTRNIQLHVPNSDIWLHPGHRIRIGRFSSITWVVSYGWYTWGGNRPVCGWYLVNVDKVSELKPLQLPDLEDVYMIEQ